MLPNMKSCLKKLLLKRNEGEPWFKHFALKHIKENQCSHHSLLRAVSRYLQHPIHNSHLLRAVF